MVPPVITEDPAIPPEIRGPVGCEQFKTPSSRDQGNEYIFLFAWLEINIKSINSMFPILSAVYNVPLRVSRV